MFDTNKVASNIKNARIKKNMTQMNLADEMGVSYQAVSNWERGTSMPDISKLPELCKILNISFEELVGERSAETGIAEKLMQDENADVTLEELAQVGELVEPDKMERKVNDLNRLAVLNRLDDLEGDDVAELAFGALEQGEDVIIYLDYMCEDDVGNLAMRALELGRNTAVFLDYMAEDDVAKLAMKALESGGNTEIFLDYMAEDDVAELAFKALETGKPIEGYLDYMCEEDIKELLLKSLKK